MNKLKNTFILHIWFNANVLSKNANSSEDMPIPKLWGFFSTQISWHYIFGRIHNLVAFSAYTLHFELKGINRQLRGLNNSGLLLSLSSKLGRIVDFDCCLNSYEFYIFISFFFSNTNVDHKNFIAEIWTIHSWMCYSNFRKVNRLSLYRKGEETWWNINR